MTPEEKDSNVSESPLAAYRIELESFQGPLDLLLHLIRKNELDIADIPIAEITGQYLAYLDIMRELDLEVASEFLVMASTLIYIKSRMLLPVDEEEEEGEGEDPREELIRRLLEYQKYKKAAEDLGRRTILNRDVFPRPETEAPPSEEDVFTEASIFQLMDAFQKVLTEAEKRTPVEMVRERFTLEEGIALIESRLAGGGSQSFYGLFTGMESRRMIITVFLGVLELIRRRRLVAVQADFGDPVTLVLREEENEEKPPWDAHEGEEPDDGPPQ